MKHFSTRLLLRLSLLPVALTVACVSSGTYDAVKVERDALESENARLEKRVQLLESSKDSLESERLALIDNMEDLREKRGELERDLRRLRQAEAELSESLAKREAELAATSQELSKLSGTSTTVSNVFTIQGKTSSQSFLRGPKAKSIMWAPASTCLTARSWKNLASLSLRAFFTSWLMM